MTSHSQQQESNGLPTCVGCDSFGKLHKVTVEWKQPNNQMTWRVVKGCLDCIEDGTVRESTIEKHGVQNHDNP